MNRVFCLLGVSQSVNISLTPALPMHNQRFFYSPQLISEENRDCFVCVTEVWGEGGGNVTVEFFSG